MPTRARTADVPLCRGKVIASARTLGGAPDADLCPRFTARATVAACASRATPEIARQSGRLGVISSTSTSVAIGRAATSHSSPGASRRSDSRSCVIVQPSTTVESAATRYSFYDLKATERRRAQSRSGADTSEVCQTAPRASGASCWIDQPDGSTTAITSVTATPSAIRARRRYSSRPRRRPLVRSADSPPSTRAASVDAESGGRFFSSGLI